MSTANISCGVNSLELEVVGKTISELRTFLASIISIDSSYKAEANGNTLSESYVVQEGDAIEFVKQSGTKG